MSNVLARDRGLSGLTFYTHLMKTRDKMENFANDTKVFSNREFDVYCVSILRECISATGYIIMANSIYPQNEHEVMIRRDFQNIAIGEIESIITELQRLLLIKKFSLRKGQVLREIIDDFESEIKYLKWWRKKNNSLMKKFGDPNTKEGSMQINPSGSIMASALLGVQNETYNSALPTPAEVQSMPDAPLKDRKIICPIYMIPESSNDNDKKTKEHKGKRESRPRNFFDNAASTDTSLSK